MSSEQRIRDAVSKAHSDKALARKLRELADLDAELTPSVIDVSTYGTGPGFEDTMTRHSDLCDKLAAELAGPKDDVDEYAVWLSHYVQEIVRQVPKRPWWWPF